MLKKRAPIFHKVTNMLRVSIFVSKMRKPVIPKLIFLKKSRKLKRLLLFKNYRKYNNYKFLKDYEFSPSTTPLIHCHKQIQLKNYGHDMFFMCRCWPGFRSGQVALPLETVLPAASVSDTISEEECLQALDFRNDEEESVDQRAEKFIERFYHDMRMQRQQSI